MSLFHTHFLLPFAEPERHAGLSKRLREIRQFERMTEKAQREEQQRRLQRILQHAYDTVPFYRRQFDDAGFRPSDACIDRPLPLPALTRNHLRGSSSDLLSTAYPSNSLRHSVTGGTTSTPMKFHRDLECLRNKTALQLRLNARSGYNVGDSVLMLWGAHNDLVMNNSWRWKLYEEKLLRRIPAPSGFINEEILERFRQRYEQHRPKVIYAYTSVLATFASYLQSRGFQHRPKVLIATAEPMDEHRRSLIQSVFGQQVYDHYGSRDVGMIASQCSAHELLHFHPWGCHVEFDPIGPTSDGPTYRLLVTDLLNYGQPFIRYDTGDCVTLAPQRCSCGSWFQSIRKVLGRMVDGIALDGGGIVPGTALVAKIQAMSGNFGAIAQVQFVQKTHQHLHLRYVLTPGAGLKQQEIETICAGIETLTNRRLKWTHEQVADIPRERSGKIRLCISEIPVPESNFPHPLLTPEQPELVN